MPANHSPKTRRRTWRPDAFVAFALVAVLAGGVAALAFTQPVTVAALAGRSYAQSGTLSYTAPVNPASVYGTSQVVTGEPLYNSSVHAVTFGYTYRFTAATARAVGGTEQLVATIDNGQGLTRTIALQPVTPFTGDRFSASATVPLSSFAAVANAFSQAAGTQGDGSYTVAISPSVVVHGQVGTAPVHATFATPVSLTLNANGAVPRLFCRRFDPGRAGDAPSVLGVVLRLRHGTRAAVPYSVPAPAGVHGAHAGGRRVPGLPGALRPRRSLSAP